MLLEIVLPCFHAGDSLLLKLLWGCLSADRRLFLSSQWSVRPFRCWIYVVSAIATRSFYQYHSAGYTQFFVWGCRTLRVQGCDRATIH
ncbi:hypothetical protein XF_1551 [Xylella fastidiosa 9a5c]|uniref:Uncharacterized protein n=1 Tax=Xylella fastidiosa (strain 9a5c) TaxID=160492 RepID=Q9PD28_XYLFA|nr:hypothetical protein XF_1551 [Xylella fastidiosa 9a5c]